MKFITKGPDIPESLLKAHEEGNVVFFCGAGISMPVDLPNFNKLVKLLYENQHIKLDNIIKDEGSDRAIHLLERRICNGRQHVRKHLSEILCPPELQITVSPTHQALLKLALNNEGKLRLVTTNFDRLFENVINSELKEIQTFCAPHLPLPKNNLNGLVYLHGLIPENPSPDQLDQLILSSGDFGRAYLSERWASRFITELFKKFTVCFVGYSLGDPVLRYLMDAFAADILEGENIPRAYAFVGYKKDDLEKRVEESWDSKNVTPIMYQIKGEKDHTLLHETLQSWAKYHSDGIGGKEQIVINCAHLKPALSTAEDNFVEKVLWCLKDQTGIPAKKFSEMDPIPSIEWLDELVKHCFKQSQLPMDDYCLEKNEENNKYSLLSRPHSSRLGEWSSPLLKSWVGPLDLITKHFCKWICRHLDKPKVLTWVAHMGGKLHYEFADFIKENLSKYPQTIQVYWNLVLAGKLGFKDPELKSFNWENRYRKEGLHLGLKEELYALLSPRLTIYSSHKQDFTSDLSSLHWEIILGIQEPHYVLSQLEKIQNWQADLPQVLDKASSLLLDTLNLMQELGDAGEFQDLSYISQPYIHESDQDHQYQEWTALIDLTRKAWLETVKKSPEKALLSAHHWISQPFPLFKRLAFFAATYTEVVSPKTGLDWLTMDNEYWLWSIETQPEVLRLITSISPKLNKSNWSKLEKLILKGPSEAIDNNTNEWDRLVGLRLAKAQKAGVSLGHKAQIVLNQICEKYPKWDPSDENLEVSFRVVSGIGSPFASRPVPQSVDQLKKWLIQHPDPSSFEKDEWKDFCKNKLASAIDVLQQLSEENKWFPKRWQEALQAWYGEKDLISQSWDRVSKLIYSTPNNILEKISHTLSWYLKEAAKALPLTEKDQFLSLCQKILESQIDETWNKKKNLVHLSINHTLGITATAMIHWAFKDNPIDKQGLDENLSLLLSKMCDTKIEAFRYARLELASNAIALFRLDPTWTKKNLLPLFSWDLSESEAANAWMGFLSSARDYLPLLKDWKEEFLSTASHLQEIDEYSGSYASLLTWIAMHPRGLFEYQELENATKKLRKKDLAESLKTIRTFLWSFKEKDTDNKIKSFWKGRVEPYFQYIWPNEKDLIIDPYISDLSAEICVFTGQLFPEALNVIKPWLIRTTSCASVIHHLKKTTLCSEFPEDCLDLLAHIVRDDLQFQIDDLGECLKKISSQNPSLCKEKSFKRIVTLVKKRSLNFSSH